MTNYSDELLRISKRCYIPLDKLKIEKNSIYGNKLLVDGQPKSLTPCGKGKEFSFYLQGIADGCDLKK